MILSFIGKEKGHAMERNGIFSILEPHIGKMKEVPDFMEHHAAAVNSIFYHKDAVIYNEDESITLI